MITVVGLGLTENDLTLRAVDVIKNADKIFVKTAKTPTYKFFTENSIEAESFDDVYDAAEDFNDLDEKIVDRLLQFDDAVFCVNGSGADDGTVVALSKKTKIKIVAGVGQQAYGAAASPDTSVMCYSAYDVVGGSTFAPDKRRTVVIREIDNKYLASDLKLALMDVYGADKKVFLSNCVEVTDNLTELALSEIDREKSYAYYTTLTLPAENFLTAARHDFTDLLDIMQGLLSENGCPWDRAQTHESIRINLIEEAYELVDAIDRGDLDGMIEESGDVLLQAVFHCMLGKADGEYDAADALTNLCHKLITRHTHIFGENKANDAEEALKCWTAAKAVEKEYTSYSDKLDKLPKNLPALLYAYKIQKIVVKCGFDWHDIDGTFDKLQEEIAEFKEASDDTAVMEAGDVLFSAINPMRWRHIEPELALKNSCDKFIKRFKFMESKITENGGDLGDEETREKYWKLSKEIYK